MSCLKNRIDFVKRSLSILKDLESKTEYEKTLFLNCCMGLLVAPQQWDQLEKHQISEEMNIDDWFIDIQAAQPNTHQKGPNNLSVENFAYHFRNSLCHHLFSILGDSEKITSIHIVDYSFGSRRSCTFDFTVGIEDLIKFVKKYAETKINLIKMNP